MINGNLKVKEQLYIESANEIIQKRVKLEDYRIVLELRSFKLYQSRVIDFDITFFENRYSILIIQKKQQKRKKKGENNDNKKYSNISKTIK